jgi:streptogramin lyase
LSGAEYGFDRPYLVVYAGGFLWVTNVSGSVTQIDPATGAAVRVITGCGLSGVRNIAADSTHLWVTDSDVNAVSELNLSDGSCVASYSGSAYGFDEPYGVWSDGAHVWVTNYGTINSGTTVTVLNAADGSVAAQLTDPSYGFSRPDTFASDGKSMWVSNFTGNSLTQIDLNTFALIRVVTGLNQPAEIAIDGSHLWVPTYGGNTVVEFDAVSGAPLNAFDAATYAFSGPTAPTVVGSYVYIANAKGNSLSRVPA